MARVHLTMVANLMKKLPKNVFDLLELREKTQVFSDRFHAGEVLSEMIQPYQAAGGLLLGIPAGGLPVAAVMREKMALEMDVAVVSKITLPWNTEAGYGAVSFDGTVRLNQAMLAHIGLSENQIQQGSETTLQKVRRRIKLLRGERPFPEVHQRPVILVDDGLASGFTMLVAAESVKKAGASEIAVAVPTGHLNAVQKIAEQVNNVFCPNIRSGMRFAVAGAYENWSDVAEEELLEILSGIEN
jgi:predicted phosphoribosyltransferase